MANENVKIIVQEVDETRPRGEAGSSDIAYVPGLGTDFVSAEYRNVPILCTSVDEFESYFGPEPYRFTQTDIDNDSVYTSYSNIKQGDYDKSYVYAKELINAGLSVLYECISNQTNALSNIGTFSSNSDNINLVTNTRNMFTTNNDNVSGGVRFTLSGLTAYGAVTIVPKSGSTVNIDSCKIVDGAKEKFTIIENKPTTENEDASEVVKATSVTIKWEDVTPNDLLNTVFEITVEVVKAGTFTMNMVEGENIGTEVAIVDNTTPLSYMYSVLKERYENLHDKNEYTVKYITSGGYPTFEVDNTLVDAMLNCAGTRNDAVALIDHSDKPSAKLAINDVDSVYYKANQYFYNKRYAEFGAMFTPWGEYNCATMSNTTSAVMSMPASFAYLMCLADAIKTSPNWLAMAGVTRGIVPNLRKLRTNSILSNVIAENYQPKYGKETNAISINAITNVKPYGLTIWGNRTLKAVSTRGTVATNFLNTRNMISDIKKLAYNTAKSLMFEQDSDTLWLSFKSGVSPLLDQLKSGSGISDYKLIKNTTKYNGDPLTRGEMSAIIKIFPLYAIEYFEITVVVSDNDVAIS